MKNPRGILPGADKGKKEHEKAGPSLYNPNAVFLSFGSIRPPSPTIPMASLLFGSTQILLSETNQLG